MMVTARLLKILPNKQGVNYLTRNENTHAKAGNLNAALARSKGDYVAIFDCDHIATRSFLQLTMGWFLKDRKLAVIQTPHYFFSPDPIRETSRCMVMCQTKGNFSMVLSKKEMTTGMHRSSVVLVLF
jgi:cellulose synthase/poly-beta-1,6-N-acetylglucosamine synthase-like glycosyltransferase